MAAVRHRRLRNLTLDLPSSSPSVSSRRFSLPPTSTSTSTSTTLSDYERLSVLGHGNGGIVYKVRHRTSSNLFALKTLSPSSAASAASREAEILRHAAGSPHVLRCHGSFPSPSGDLSLLLELVDGGSLDSILRKRNNSPFPEPALAIVARHALLGLSHLHSQRIVHRDLKPSNLLVNSSGEVKIADFGVGKILRRELNSCLSYVGTAAYMSPERFDPETYGGDYDPYAADVWSLGIAILELKLGYFPLLQKGQRPDWAALMCAICFGEAPSLPESVEASAEIRDFIGLCLQKESRKRATISDLLKHPFVSGGDFEQEKKVLLDLLKEAEAAE
ncbi:Mitogen-activated protein kinase kinase 9 [Rhynchospora pubera]|uniref:mitogen-activated protein kinase kinase n=1 Tax=Rhynchospora pubera TaxID=906938 RepID=A0AAV8FXG8_9POAL|nr:Mitogen-activated protein kinase kinase 9 [Rhynchospora pubera]